MSDALRIGIAGLGTVGVSVFKMLTDEKDRLDRICGREIEIVAVSARDKNKDRGIDTANVKWFDNPVDMASDADIDMVLELVGGSEGAAFDIVAEAIKNNKMIVTANKALLALRGKELYELSKNSDAKIYYEAAIGGAIPCVKVLREGLLADNICGVSGILNGTSNYILTEMSKTGRGFDEVLEEAQEKGYAEADPTFDVEGNDAAHKIALLSALSFGTLPNYDAINLRGIKHINADDIAIAKELGYCIKLLSVAYKSDDGISMSVEPCLIPVEYNDDFANTDGVLNAVCFTTDYAGKVFLKGEGAGGNATASAVMSDIVSLANGGKLSLFNPVHADLKFLDDSEAQGEFFIRIEVEDEMDIPNKVAEVLSSFEVPLESMLETEEESGEVLMVLITRYTKKANVLKALDSILKLDGVKEDYDIMRIESV